MRWLQFAIYAAGFALLLEFIDSENQFYSLSLGFLVESEVSWLKILIVSAALLGSWFLPTKFKKPSDLMLHVQYMFPVIPMLALFFRFDLKNSYMLTVLTAYLLMVLTISSLSWTKCFIWMKVEPILLAKTFNFLAGLLILAIILAGGWVYFNLNFWEVYGYRRSASENLPGFFEYLIHLTTKVLLPCATVLGWCYRKYAIVAMSFAAGALLFGLTAHKAMLFYPLMALTVYLIASRGNLVVLPFSQLIGLLLTFGFMQFGSDSLALILVDRAYLIPAEINFMYADWFALPKNPFVYWSDSKISLGLVNYPYDIQVPFLIGREYVGDSESGANTGWLGAGYGNAGAIGVLMYGLMIGVLLSLFDSFSRQQGRAVVVAIIFGPVISLMVSADLPVSLLSHGLLLVFLVLASMRSAKLEMHVSEKK